MADGAIEQIKEKLDIVNEIGATVGLRRSGKAYKGLCPFHDERSPSFYVFPDTKTWRCFGCNEGGDLFTFVAKQQNLDFGEVLRTLAEKAGVNLGGRADEPFEPSLQSQARARLKTMNEAAAVWFHHQLLTAPSATYARSYLQTRGISNETIERFRLGYAPEGDHLAQYLIGQDYAEEEIIEAGLARRRDADKGGGVYDYFRNRLIFTIRDTREQTVGFGARELGGGTPKYLNTPQTVLFDKSATLYALDQARETIKKLDEAVVVEGYVDAIIAHQYGYRNTIACIGSAITTKHVHLIKKLTRHLTLALDPDAAGEAATLRAIQVAQEGFDRVLVPVPVPATHTNPSVLKGDDNFARRKRKDGAPQGMIRFEEQVDADIRVLQLPDGVDPDEFIRADPPAWAEALKNALPLMDFYITTLIAGLDLHAPAGQAEASRRLFPVLATVGDRIKQDAYVRRLASLLRIPERDAQMELQRHRRQHLAQASPASGGQRPDGVGDKYQNSEAPLPPRNQPGSQLESRANAAHAWEERCIGLLLGQPGTHDEVCVILESSDFWGTETRALFALLAAPDGPRTRAAVDALLAKQPAILQVEAERLRQQFVAQPAMDRMNLARNAKQIAFRLKRLRLSDAITEISYLQREAETQADREAAHALRAQAQRLTAARLSLDAANVLQT